MVTDVTSVDTSPPALPRFEFLAGRLSLDFCNSLSQATGGDRLAEPAALAGWAARIGRPMGRMPTEAETAGMRSLRGHLLQIFDAVTRAATPPQTALNALAASGGLGGIELHWDRGAGRAAMVPAGGALAGLRHDIVTDAVALLTGTALARVKRCPNHDCRWFFFDTSRNGRRRWCAMADCGTRDKVRRFRDRHGAGTSPAF